mgnify:CR=1 FL=1
MTSIWLGSENLVFMESLLILIRFGEFSMAGNTSFLRAGVNKNLRQIKQIIVDAIDVDKILGQ